MRNKKRSERAGCAVCGLIGSHEEGCYNHPIEVGLREAEQQRREAREHAKRYFLERQRREEEEEMQRLFEEEQERARVVARQAELQPLADSLSQKGYETSMVGDQIRVVGSVVK